MSRKVKRSLTDEEVGLIRGMLARGMPNDEIHYYFNRLDRLVSSGRITQIKQGRYAAHVPAAPDERVSNFIEEWKRRDQQPSYAVDHKKEPTHPEVIRQLFEGRTDGWFVKNHETEMLECKESFRLKPEERFSKIIRAIAGLANNSGGYILLGIKEVDNKNLKVVGLPDGKFVSTDPAEISRCLVSTLSPVPKFRMATVELDGMTVGVIHVEEHQLPPIMAIKNVGEDVKEGSIYFRYVGETRPIKPAELWEIISYREKEALKRLSQSVARVANGNAVTLDLDSGVAEGTGGRFAIDRDLLEKVQFIREGEFKETGGAPALRLVGDVVPVDRHSEAKTQIIRTNLTSCDILRSFLLKEPVSDPLQYIIHNAHSSRKWLPIWYYLASADISPSDAIELLNKQRATRPTHREFAIQRLRGTQPAFRRPTGRPKQMLSALNDQSFSLDDTGQIDSIFIYAVQGLPSGRSDVDQFRSSLLICLDRAEGNNPRESARQGAIYRAACRLDEILYCRELSTV